MKDRLGTCDFNRIGTRYHETPHLQAPTCVNWREQPAQGEGGEKHCVHCGKSKDDPAHSETCKSIIDKHNFETSTSGLSAEQLAKEKRRAIFDGLNDVFTADQWIVIERGMAYFGELYAAKLREERDALKRENE